MYTDFITILIFLLVGALIVPLMLLVGKTLRPHHPYKEKLIPYECGELPVGNSWVQFNLRFYVIAILFLIFEVEVVLMLPVATMFKKWMSGSPALAFLIFLEIVFFVLILILGFAYAWTKGDFEWIRPSQRKNK